MSKLIYNHHLYFKKKKGKQKPKDEAMGPGHIAVRWSREFKSEAQIVHFHWESISTAFSIKIQTGSH